MIEDDRETRLTGMPISGGVALGKTCLFRERRHDGVPEFLIQGDQIAAEHERLDVALQAAQEHLDNIIREVGEKIGQAEAAIFTVQKMILQDPVLTDKIKELIEHRSINSEAAVT